MILPKKIQMEHAQCTFTREKNNLYTKLIKSYERKKKAS